MASTGPNTCCEVAVDDAETKQAMAAKELTSWLEQRLHTELAALMDELKVRLDRLFIDHHRAVLDGFQGCLSSAPAGRCSSLSQGGCESERLRSPEGSSLERSQMRPELAPDNGVHLDLSGGKGQPKDLVTGPSTKKDSIFSRDKINRQRSSDQYKSKHFALLAARRPTESILEGHAPLVRRLVASGKFEVLCSLMIILNTIAMACEVQYIGCDVAHTIGHPDCEDAAEEIWPGAALTFRLMPLCFTVFFLCEFLLRLAAMRQRAVRDAWMWFDLLLLAVGIMDAVERLKSSIYLSLNPAMMRTLRICRMMRIMRFFKTDGLSSFYLLLKSLLASRQALVWSVIFLYFTMTSVGVLMNQMIYSELAVTDLSIADQHVLFELFGTYTRTLITMLELTLGNWAPPSRVLMSKISQWWGLFIAIYRGVVCFGLVNVTSAVFITETTRVASSDDEVLMLRKDRTARDHARKLRALFEELDESGDGFVTLDEFRHLLDDDIMRQFLSIMEVEVDDCEAFFHILDDGKGRMQADDFIRGVQTIKGQARNLDLLTLMALTRKMDAKLDAIGCGLRPPFSGVRK